MKSIFENYPIENGSYSDAVTYVRVLLYIAAIDGVHEDEVKGIKYLINAHNWAPTCYTDAEKEPITSINDLGLSEETKKVFSAYLLRDAVAVAHLEGGYSDDEKAHIKAIANELSFDPSKLSMIEAAVSDQLSAIRKWSKAI
tara:strand:- start:1296 stop:1721 length:426 start_codon:yes stop_codon:yes gene_type:complete